MTTTNTNAATLLSTPREETTTVTKTKTVTEKFDAEGNLIERVTEDWEETTRTPKPSFYYNPSPTPSYPIPVITYNSSGTAVNTTDVKKPEVTVNITGDLDPKKIADEVSRHMSTGGIVQRPKPVTVGELPLSGRKRRDCGCARCV